MRKLSRMTPRLLRLVYAFEFLFALVAIFTAWSEIGGQAALDLMYWAWKLGLGFSLAASIVAFTAAMVAEESAWTLRSARWLAVIIVLVCAIGVVTWYYASQEQTNEPEENGTVSMLLYPAVHSQNYA
jgi:fucose 4-O-acetylase-like acetyltransferase